MLSAREALAEKFARYAMEKERHRVFLSEIAGPTVTWGAIGVTYSSLHSSMVSVAAWSAVMLSLFGLHIALATWKLRTIK